MTSGGGGEGRWRRSSSCSADNGCVEARHVDDMWQLRGVPAANGKPLVLTYTEDEWRDFVAGVKNGEFDSD